MYVIKWRQIYLIVTINFILFSTTLKITNSLWENSFKLCICTILTIFFAIQFPLTLYLILYVYSTVASLFFYYFNWKLALAWTRHLTCFIKMINSWFFFIVKWLLFISSSFDEIYFAVCYFVFVFNWSSAWCHLYESVFPIRY